MEPATHPPVDTAAERVSIPTQRREPSREGSLTQARVDAYFRSLRARREFERRAAELADEPVTPLQRTAD